MKNIIINENEYNMAMKKEEEYYEIIKKYFNFDNLIKTDKYHKFDYIHLNKNKNVYIELKTRKIKHNVFDCLIFNNDKILFGLSKNVDMIFIFEYCDKTLYIKYEKELFDNYTVKRINNRSDRGMKEFINCIFIPLKDMKEFIF
jgi:hypothetical protein